MRLSFRTWTSASHHMGFRAKAMKRTLKRLRRFFWPLPQAPAIRFGFDREHWMAGFDRIGWRTPAVHMTVCSGSVRWNCLCALGHHALSFWRSGHSGRNVDLRELRGTGPL